LIQNRLHAPTVGELNISLLLENSAFCIASDISYGLQVEIGFVVRYSE
jgi:hypothetical protein